MNHESLASLIDREVDLDRLLSGLGKHVAHRIGAKRATIWLIDAHSQELFSHLSDEPKLEELRLTIGHGIVGRCAQGDGPRLIEDVQTDPDWAADIDQATGFRTKNMCCVPIRDREGGTIGVIQALNLSGSLQGSDVIHRLESISDELTGALEYTSLQPSMDGIGVKVRGRFNHIVGSSAPMTALYEAIIRAAAVDATILLRGETGTGKGLFARAIHVNSPRHPNHYVYLDCTTLPESLVESELFGHERGAFTGADRQTPGKVEVANGGTLFIDEIGELPLPLQAKLLRFVQDREFERVGGRRTLKSDVRIVAATNRDLGQMVDEGTFRSDLYYRLRVLEIELPSLIERGADEITLLAEHFLGVFRQKFNRPQLEFSQPAVEALRSHTWPGNVRELQHTVERAAILSATERIQPRDLGFSPASSNTGLPAAQRTGALPLMIQRGDSLQTAIKAYAQYVVDENGGNLSAAARTLQISRNRLNRILND